MATTPGTAVPGTSVPSGSAVGPGGAQGIQGLPGPIVVSSDAGNIATIGSDNQILVPQSQIWSVRQRTFSSIGNPTFEVDQRNAGTLVTNIATGAFACDRWSIFKNGTMTINTQRIAQQVVVPGTNFLITNGVLSIQMGTLEASLAAGDYCAIQTVIEGSTLRELYNDAHSVSVLAWSSVANLKFSLVLIDSTGARSLCKLCSLGAANAPVLITLPNLPSFVGAGGGTFNLTPGNIGYFLRVGLCAGTSFLPSANDAWVAGNFAGAIGMNNFAAQAGSFQLAMIQHEPGPVCSTLIDCPFEQNLRSCKRYYAKDQSYNVKVGSTGNMMAMLPAVPGYAVAQGFWPYE